MSTGHRYYHTDLNSILSPLILDHRLNLLLTPRCAQDFVLRHRSTPTDPTLLMKKSKIFSNCQSFMH